MEIMKDTGNTIICYAQFAIKNKYKIYKDKSYVIAFDSIIEAYNYVNKIGRCK